MKSELKYYKSSESKAKIFQREIPKYGFTNLGTRVNNEGNWIAYHHHDSGTSLVVEYNREVDKNNAMIRLRGLSKAIKETLISLNKLNLGVVEDN